MSDPVRLEAGIQMMAAACPDQSSGTWDSLRTALDEGFKRAWTSIRDGNASSIITAAILIEMGTGFVKGFAVTLVVGVLLSMFTAVNISRTLLKVMVGEWIEDKLWLIGVKKDKNV